jgi:YYY domain-containing protein
MLGLVATLVLPANEEVVSAAERRGGKVLWYLFAAFVFGTIACVNPWDIPVYALILAVVLMVRTIQEKRQAPKLEMFVSLGYTVITFVLLCGLGYLLYFPFYASYQELYVNGLGPVTQGTTLSDYFTVFGLWTFITLSFFIMELYRWWKTRSTFISKPHRIAGYILLCGVVLIFVTLISLKVLLLALIALGIFLFFAWMKTVGAARDAQFIVSNLLPKPAPNLASNFTPDLSPGPASNLVPKFVSSTFDATTSFAYLLLLVGLCITLGQEIVYVRDFLDGGDYYRMNTVFKFSMQAWLCFAIGGALAVQRIYHFLGGIIQRVWLASLIALVLGCSVFLSEGTTARINDHQVWVDVQHPVQSADYTPTIDGFAFVRAWYPSDAQAITWLNDHVSGSPIILEASAPVSFQWYNRVSVFTGLPDVLGWPDHVGEQRYDYQPLNRETDINIMYTTADSSLTVELLRYYHVHYIYVGPLEQQLYGPSNGLEKFNKMVGTTLRIVYNSNHVIIYEML